jgi:hypothetical protein
MAIRQRIKQPSMRIKNVQTNNIYELSNREQIGKCLKQTFNSQVSCERFVDGEKRDDFIIRAIPRFQILDCDKELKDLIPNEEATVTIREKLLGKNAVNKIDTLEDLKKFCYEKGIHHSPSIGYERLKEKVDKYKELNGKTQIPKLPKKESENKD